MMEDAPKGNFDYTHLKAIHVHLFQDVYDWAGEERTVSISKGNTQFANPRFIANEVSTLLKELENEDRLGLLDAEDFVERAAHYMVELNMIHPFREGNGRVSRYFLALLSDAAGYGVDMDRLTDGWLAACLAGVNHGEESMRDLIASALVVFDD